MHTEYWVVSFWFARFLEVLGLARRVEDSQSSTSPSQARNKKRTVRFPRRHGAKKDNNHPRVTVESWTGNPVSAGGVAKLLTLSV